MYGTVARLRVKPGMEDQLADELRTFERANVQGALATYLYRMDAEPNVCYMAVLFADRASYVANAASPEQDARYRKVRALLTSDPEWHDGEVVYAMGPSRQGLVSLTGPWARRMIRGVCTKRPGKTHYRRESPWLGVSEEPTMPRAVAKSVVRAL